MDASFLRNDWWQKVRNLWNPPKEVVHGEEEEEEEEDMDGGERCAAGGNIR